MIDNVTRNCNEYKQTGIWKEALVTLDICSFRKERISAIIVLYSAGSSGTAHFLMSTVGSFCYLPSRPWLNYEINEIKHKISRA
jgi:hypothetical protein